MDVVLTLPYSETVYTSLASITYSSKWFTDFTFRNDTNKRAECFQNKPKFGRVCHETDLAQTKRAQLSTNGILL